jgi:hypothetical protein
MIKFFSILLVLAATSTMAQTPPVMRQTGKVGGAEITKLTFNLSKATLRSMGGGKTEVYLPGINLMTYPGLPKLPFYSFVVAAHLKDISVQYQLGTPHEYKVGRLAPCPPEKLRCNLGYPMPTVDRVAQYAQHQAFYKVDYLGDFRGTPLHRVTLFPHQYDLAGGKLSIYPKAEYAVQIRNGTADYRAAYRLARSRGSYDYLVIAPPEFKESLQPWIDYKTKSQNLRFKVVHAPARLLTPDSLRQLIHAEYKANGFMYALIVGSQQIIPNFRMNTTSTPSTPTDLPYYTMGGENDFIPDVLAGRMVASNATDVSNQTKKWISYEQGLGQPAQGWMQAVGIASSEGSNPSDEEYVRNIEKIMAGKLGTRSLHLAERDPNSNPTVLNNAFNGGLMWTVYMGHGSGTDWPSFYQTYSTRDIKKMTNAAAVKPVWIDVACQNGILGANAAGERLSNEVDAQGAAIGTTAYYGGSVNISWHPPAILATGITIRMVEEPRPILASVIQMGHAYLAENISDLNEIRSNQIWYHLQGDPSLNLRLRNGRNR